MAALLGAQSKTRAVGGRDVVAACFPGTMGTAARGLIDKNRDSRPHIVEVLPVPGGLMKAFNLDFARRDKRLLTLE